MLNSASIRVWSIGGGKGGIGKSILTLGLGLVLSRLGRQVILIDGDLGGANLHTLLGVRYPAVTLEDFLQGKLKRLEDAVIPTAYEGLGLICGADDILGSANPTHSQKIKLLQEIADLPADFVLLDLGAGTSFNILDLFNYSPGKIALCTAQTTSLQSSYGFIKAALYRKLSLEFAKQEELFRLLAQIDRQDAAASFTSLAQLLEKIRDFAPEIYFRIKRILDDFQLFLVVNMVRAEGEERSPEIIRTVCSEYLRLRPQILGTLDYDPVVEQAVNRTAPQLLLHGKSQAAAGLLQMAKRLLVLGRLSGRDYALKTRENVEERGLPPLVLLPGQTPS
ncbi:MAG: P-loop NTPase [Deltaproteobacteria bacterium]|nr:P-loop NTPase [Deltaproteobacteria bacterium]